MINANDPRTFPDTPTRGGQASLRKKQVSPPGVKRAAAKKHEKFPGASESQRNVSYIFDAQRDAHSVLPYYEQFDPEMNTPEKMMERSALKYHPDVREAIRKMHSLFPRDENGCIHKEEYCTVHEKMLRGLIPNFRGDLREVAEDDWLFDTQGADTLDTDRFFEAIFTLVDLWTLSTNAEEYVAFLETLANKIRFPHQVEGTAPYDIVDRHASGLAVKPKTAQR